MQNYKKISTVQLYLMWKNLSISLLLLILLMALSKLLHPLCTPLISLGCAAYLYYIVSNARRSERTTCILLPYTMLVCTVAFTFVTIALVLIGLWSAYSVDLEFVCFNRPFVPSLILNPVCFVCISVIYFRRKHLGICVECKIKAGGIGSRNRLNDIISYETYLQLRNLMLLFGILSVTIWLYYYLFYIKINANARDWYVFTWLNVIAFLLDEVYFIFRYYNLYLDLKENNEIISQEEINNMSATTYVRYYVVCGNDLYIDPKAVENFSAPREVIDTPFQTRRSINGMSLTEIRRIIVQMTGIEDGELRFFYGRKNPSNPKASLLRYFYFVKPDADGRPPELRTEGEWMNFDKVLRVYAQAPGKLASLSVADTSRLATIILTEKIFDDRGFRKNKIKAYNPTFNLIDVYKSTLDFQDDKWIRIALFNSDTPFFRLKRFWRKISGKSVHKQNQLL